jgi:uncharacterized protein involved in exopolysaccharide biosynthesis
LAVTAEPVLREPAPHFASAEEGANSGLSLAQIFAIVWAYRIHAAAIAGIIVLCTAIVIKRMPKTYTATATLLVSYETNDPLAGGQNSAMPVFSYMATEIQLMQSSELLLPVIERLKLTEKPEYAAGYVNRGSPLAEWVKERLVKDLEIEAGRAGSQLIYVTAAARDPELAAQIANTLVEIYLSQQHDRLSGPASERAKRYAAELAELKHKVSLAQDQVTAYRQRTGVTDAGARSSVEADMLASLETRLQEAQNARRAAEVAAQADHHASAAATASATIQTLRTEINTEQAQLAQMRATMGIAHPKVIEMQNQIDANKRILESEFGTVSAAAGSDLAEARQLEAKLQAAVQEQRAKVLAINRLEDEGTKYVLELESAQSVYKRALDGYDSIMFASGSSSANISSVSRAVPGQTSIKPNKFKLMLMGLVAGIGLGLLGPVGYELLINRRIRCRDDFERGFAIPVLMEFDRIPAPRRAT